MSEANTTNTPNRRWLPSTLATVVCAVAVFAGYYAVRRAEAQTALRHYDIALRFHDASAVNDQFLYEISSEILEAQRRIPFTGFDQPAAGHVARIEALRDKFIARLPGINVGPDHIEILDALVAEAREWQRSGKRPVRKEVELPLFPDLPPPSE